MATPGFALDERRLRELDLGLDLLTNQEPVGLEADVPRQSALVAPHGSARRETGARTAPRVGYLVRVGLGAVLSRRLRYLGA